MQIRNIYGRKILNSVGEWTIEVEIELDEGTVARASVPGGFSRGTSEVDTIEAEAALFIIEEIKDELIGREFKSTFEFDIKLLQMDNSENKSKLGGNTLIGLSVAFTKAIAMTQKHETYEYIHKLLNPEIPLEVINFKMPKYMMLMLEGGSHGSSDATIQEFMAIVDEIPRGVEIYNAIKKELHDLGKSTNVGAEGAFSPEGFDNRMSLEVMTKFLRDEEIALDAAASSISKGDLPNYEELLTDFPISSIEDPLGENDWANWEFFASKHLNKIQIVTDDLTTTNPKLLSQAIKRNVGNAIIIKPNQIGTIYETLKVVKMAKDAGWKVIVSHRGTDTNDDFISDLAVGIQSDYVKFGSPARGERVAKYNRLLEIAELI